MLGESTQPWKHFHLIGTNSSIAKGTTDLRFECPSTTTWYYRKRQFQESLVSSFATSKHLLLQFMNLFQGEGLLYNMCTCCTRGLHPLSIRPFCQVSSRLDRVPVQYQKSYLDLGFWYCICPTQPIITNTETAMLSISNDRARWKPQSCKPVRLTRVWGSVKHVYIVHVLARVLYTRASTCVYARARPQ